LSDDQALIARAGRAERELELTRQAFAQLRAAALEELVGTALGQQDKRERLYVVASMIDGVQGALQRMIDDGLVAREALAAGNLLRP
jgi:hypothetical protein